jgi:hypothetical protein
LHNNDRSIFVGAQGQAAVAVNKVASIQAEKAIDNEVWFDSGNIQAQADGEASVVLNDLASITAGYAENNFAGARIDGNISSKANNADAMTKIASIDANQANAVKNRTEVTVFGGVETYAEQGSLALTRIGSIESLSGGDLLGNSTHVQVNGHVFNGSSGQGSSSVMNIGSIVQ